MEYERCSYCDEGIDYTNSAVICDKNHQHIACDQCRESFGDLNEAYCPDDEDQFPNEIKKGDRLRGSYSDQICRNCGAEVVSWGEAVCDNDRIGQLCPFVCPHCDWRL